MSEAKTSSMFLDPAVKHQPVGLVFLGSLACGRDDAALFGSSTSRAGEEQVRVSVENIRRYILLDPGRRATVVATSYGEGHSFLPLGGLD